MMNEETVRAQFSSARSCCNWASEHITAVVDEFKDSMVDIRTRAAVDSLRREYLKDAYSREFDYMTKLSKLELEFNMKLEELLQYYYHKAGEMINDYNFACDSKQVAMRENFVELIKP